MERGRGRKQGVRLSGSLSNPRVGRIHVSAGFDGELEDLELTVYTTTQCQSSGPHAPVPECFVSMVH